MIDKTDRWSFSVPPDADIDSESETPRLSISIPDEVINYAINECVSSSISPPPKTQITSTTDVILITSIEDTTEYIIPSKSAYDARRIWKRARIPHYSIVRDIETKLVNWAFKYAQLKIVDNKIQMISWITHSKCICSSTWSAFIKWMLCACLSDTDRIT
jgi:hypothetical protein